LLFRLALPNIVGVPEDFAQLYGKMKKKGSLFLKGLLMQNLKLIEAVYEVTAHRQQILDRIMSLQNDLFNMCNDLESFEIL